MFVDLNRVSPSRLLVVVGAATVVWLGLTELMPAKIAHAGTVILGALSAGLTFLLKAETKHVETRNSDIVRDESAGVRGQDGPHPAAH